MRKIVVTGASGFLGSYFIDVARRVDVVAGLYKEHSLQDTPVKGHVVDLRKEKETIALLKRLAPDVIVHLAAASSPNFCAQQPILSHEVNVFATQTLAEFAKSVNIPLVFTSTDQVFNGAAGPYSEDDFPHPVNIYGEQKVLAEDLLLNEYPNTVVCRLPLLYGWSARQQNFIEHWLETWAEGEILSAFADEYRSPLWVQDAAEWLYRLVTYTADNYEEAGKLDAEDRLWHLGGPERMSRFHMAEQLATHFQITEAGMYAASQQDATMLAARPADVSLQSEKAQTRLHFVPKNFERGLQAMSQQKAY